MRAAVVAVMGQQGTGGKVKVSMAVVGNSCVRRCVRVLLPVCTTFCELVCEALLSTRRPAVARGPWPVLCAAVLLPCTCAAVRACWGRCWYVCARRAN